MSTLSLLIAELYEKPLCATDKQGGRSFMKRNVADNVVNHIESRVKKFRARRREGQMSFKTILRLNTAIGFVS